MAAGRRLRGSPTVGGDKRHARVHCCDTGERVGIEGSERGTARRRACAVITFAVFAAALFAATARAGVVTRREHVRARASGLTAAERRAITVTSLSVAGDDSVGAVVRVTFQGNVEHYLGERHLSHALVALVLVPAGGGLPTGVIDEGSARFERVLRMTSARPAGVIRQANQATFYIAGVRLSRFAKVELKVFATSPSKASWSWIRAAKAAEMLSLTIDSRTLVCAQLTSLRNQLGQLRSSRIASEIRRIVKARAMACALPRPPAPRPTPTTTTATTPPPPPVVNVVQTDSALSQRMAVQPAISFSSRPPTGVQVIDVNDQIGYQRFFGLGAALTDSAAWLIHDQLSSADQATLMQDLVGPAGIHLNFLRVPMGASDFTVSPDPYSYDDMPAGQTDASLSQFSVAHDLAYIIPALQAALAVDPGLQILANPWSPPGWMKANDALDNSNDQGTLLPSAYGPLADYFVKFIQAYASLGVPVSALTPQNEPRATTPYPGMTFPSAQEAQWITQDLQPALAAAGLRPRIYGGDDTWLSDAQALLASPAASALSGIAWHCYSGLGAMSELHAADPSAEQIVSECSTGIVPFSAAEIAIDGTRNWATAVVLWNLALDPSEGPVQVGGCPHCTSVVTINEAGPHEATLGQNYYQLGQVSKFVRRGAVRIGSNRFVTDFYNSTASYGVTAGLDDVAFLNPDGNRVLVATNNSRTWASFAVRWRNRAFTYGLGPGSTVTFTWK